MTRSGKKISKVRGIVIHALEIDESYGNNYIKYIENLKHQSSLYLSYNYIIDECGKVVMIIPDTEISYHTPNFLIDKECIGVAVLSSPNKAFNKNQIKKLRRLLKKILKKYKLDKESIFLYSDIISTRDVAYYTDNYFEWEQIKNI